MAKKFTHQKKAVKKAGIRKRHTFTSDRQRVQSKHVSTVAAGPALDFSPELDEAAKTQPPALLPAPLTLHLQHLSLLNLTLPFQALVKRLTPLVPTHALLLFNAPVVTQALVDVLADPSETHAEDGSGAIPAVLELLPSLAKSLLAELLPALPEVLDRLLALANSAQHLPLLFGPLPALLKPLTPLLLAPAEAPTLDAVFAVWRPYLTLARDGGKAGNDEARRLAVEGWGNVVRRGGRGEVGARLVRMLVQELEREPAAREGVALALVEAMKGPKNTIPSLAPSLFSALLTQLLALPPSSPLPAARVLSNVLTALAHHAAPAFSQLEPVLEVLLDEGGDLIKAGDERKLRVWMGALCVSATVRAGKAITASLLPKYLALLPLLQPLALASQRALLPAHLNLTSALLALAALPEWLKLRALVRALYTACDTASRRALVGLWVEEEGGKGWKRGGDVLLRPVVEDTLAQDVGGEDKLAALGLVRHLQGAGLLSALPAQALEKVARELAGVLERSAAPAVGNSDVVLLDLALSGLQGLAAQRSAFWSALVALLQRLLQSPAAASAPASFALGRVLSTTADLLARDPAGTPDVRALVAPALGGILSAHGADTAVLQGLAELLPLLGLAGSADAFSAHVHSLKGALLVPSSAARLAALSILAALAPSRTGAGESATGTVVLQRAVELEQLELTVEGAREKCLRVAKLGRALASLQQGEEVYAEVGARTLIAQLKVNFRPLYAAVHTAFSTLTPLPSLGPLIWSLLSPELALAASGATDSAPTAVEWDVEMRDLEEADGAPEVLAEEVKQFRDPWRTAREELLSVELRKDDGALLESIQKSQLPAPRERLDVLNYEVNLVHTLAASAELAERHARDVVPVFLAFAARSPHLALEPSVVLAPPEASSGGGPRLNLKQLHAKLSAYLELLAKFKNPKALFRTDELHALYMALLAKGDPRLQQLALDCLFTYKSASVTPYKDHLTQLMDDARFRDQLAKFPLQAKENDAIDPRHRAELLPLVVRLLYGKLIQRRGKGGAGAQTRKQAILAALAGCLPGELEVLVDLMLKPFAALEGASSSSSEFAFADDDVLATGVPGKQQIGFLTLLGDVLRLLGPQLVPFWPRLLGVTMELVHRAQKRLGKMKEDEDAPADGSAAGDANDNNENADDDNVAEEEDHDDDDAPEPAHHVAPLRTVRQLGIKRFAEFFKSAAAPSFDFAPYLPPAFRSFITPRLAALDAENTQAPSGLLELFAVWSASDKQVPILVEYDRQLLLKVYACLTATNVKPAVISRTFDIVERLLAHAAAAEDGAQKDFLVDRVIRPYTDELLDRLSTLVERPVGLGPVRDELAKRQIRILSDLAAYVTNGGQSARLVGLLSPMLRQPHKVISEKTKTNILVIFESLVPLVPEFSDPASEFFTRLYSLLATLFRTIRARQARQALCRAFEKFAEADPTIRESTDVVIALNAFSEKRREEPDFDRRLEAYTALNERLYATITPAEWLPLLYNMLHFVQDPEEMALRVNSAYAMRRFIELVATRREDEALQSTFSRMLYPGIRNGLRSRVELVRTELLSVLAAAVGACDHIPLMQEMRPLLANGDAEASFFTNIHHIQVHRRVRALHRLSDLCDEGTLRNSSLLADVFLPLIGHFIGGAGGAAKVDHNLINETIATTGKVARHIRWGAYNALVRQYLRLGRLKDDNEKYYIRTVVAVLDGFHFSMEDAVVDEPVVTEDAEDEQHETEAAPAPDAAAAVDDAAPSGQPTKSQAVRIADAVESKLLPTLLQYLEQKDETEDSIRLPIAIGIVKVALNLPESTRDGQISRLLTTLSQVFRSKSQETRDLAKETIIKITVILGPAWLASIVQEMKASLQRGPQLHVLAFVVHAILVHVTALATADFSDLDDCVANVVAIAGEVVFGESGKDLQAEGFKTKMREVRSSTAKGLDTFQLVARLVSPGKLKAMLLPVREVLSTTQVLKILQQVDDVLRRIATGLNSNERVTPGDMLVLVNTLVGQNSQFLKVKAKSTRIEADRNGAVKNYTVDMKRVVKKEVDYYGANAHKFVAFGLELFFTGFRRGHFNFADPEILARLEPLVNVVGNTLYAADSGVVIAGLKAVSSLVKCPLESLPPAIPALVQQVFVITKQAGGTDSEVCQAALKTLSVIMRDCKTIEVSQKQLKYILDLISPDMEDPARQSTLFTILRAIISRKFVIADIYDMMDRVSELMVQGSSTQVQELCRVTLLQFLLDYPQGKGRLKKQMQFLAKNLAYTYESGRLSVMELLSAIFNKFSLELIREYSDLFLVALVMVIANDESIKCREFAAELVRSLFQRMDEEQRSKSITTLHTWATTTSQAQLPRLAAQVYGLFVDALKTDAGPFVSMILLDLQAMLATSAVTLEAFETAQDDPSPFEMEIDDELDWQLPYQALNSLAKVLQALPERVTSVEWKPIVGHMLFPHAWVRLASSRLLGTLFGTAPPSFDKAHVSPADTEPLQPRGLFDIARKSLLQLKGESIDEGLAMQVVKNMVYLGRCFALGPSEANAAFPAPVVEEEAAPVDPYAEVPEEEEEEDEAPEEAPVDVDEEMGEEEAVVRALSNPLAWLFTKLSQTARHVLILRPAVHGGVSLRRSLPVLSIFRLCAALFTILPAERVSPFLMQVLHPIQRVLDGDIRGEDEMRNLAIELQTLVQDKVGVSAFSSVWNSIARTKAMKRQARRNQRIIQATTNPAAAAQRKEKRQEAKKSSHKRRDRGFADNKLRERPLKARRTRDPMRDDD